MIALKGLTKRYARTVALQDVTLSIDAGERVAICGPSGCGKTTLLRLIAGFERPDAGEIRILRMIASTPQVLVPPERRNIAMVFQDLALWPHLRVKEHLAFGLERVISERSARARAIDATLRMLQLDGKAAAYPSALSGGEQQRVALGRALIRQPAILLMDEPLAHVDSALRDALVPLILALQAQHAITLIYVTHDQDLAERLAGTMVRMAQGRVASINRHHA